MNPDRHHRAAMLIGSLRRESLSRRLALAMSALTPPTLALGILECGDLPMYNPDLDGDEPVPWRVFRSAIADADAVLFVTPEYNRSVPAVLKNALDVGSRPAGMSVWRGKPAAVISLSPGALGGFGAQHHLRQSLLGLNVLTMAQPEAYLSAADRLFDKHGGLQVPATEIFLRRFLQAFADWVGLLQHRTL